MQNYLAILYFTETFSVLPRATGSAYTQVCSYSHLHFAALQCTKPGKAHLMK